MICAPFVLKEDATNRSRSNVVGLFALMLDFDTEDSIRPITIQEIQSVVGSKTRVILHSTFSGNNKRSSGL
jgi:hypothetical protein